MGELSFRRRKKVIRLDIVKKIFIWIIQLIAVNLLAFMLVAYLGKQIPVIGDSMEPQLKEGDVALVNRFSYLLSRPKRGDVIVFKPNGNENSHYYIKRVAALPGETVQIIDGQMFITDDKGQYRLEELAGIKLGQIEYAGVAKEPITLEPDEYFVIGDNAAFSEDSRYADIGNVKKDAMEGKAWCRHTTLLDFKKVQ